MKGQRLFINNPEEFEKHLKLGLKDEPKPEIITKDYWFKVECVSQAFITTDNYISATISGLQILLVNKPYVWRRIKAWLNK